jgi:hypothetical protein
VRVERDLEGLTLRDLSDREFLLVIRDAGGVLPTYVTAADIAEHLRLTGDHPIRSVSSRLAWMKRLGAVEREYERDTHGNIRVHAGSGKPITTQGWALSDLGFQMAIGKLTKTQEQSLERLKDGQMLVTVAWMTQRVQNDPTVGRLMDRAYRSGLGKR